MKKGNKNNDSEMQAEYDFSSGVRGKYARRYAEGTNVVVLDPDVAKLFPNAEAANQSLRNLAKTIRHRKICRREIADLGFPFLSASTTGAYRLRIAYVVAGSRDAHCAPRS